VSGVKATGPREFTDQFKNGTKIFNGIIFGVALISLLVGGLSVVNTMTMSVYERTREIGIRKAIGASHRQIVGHSWWSRPHRLPRGASGCTGLDRHPGSQRGHERQRDDPLPGHPRLALGSLAFAIVLGVGAASIPPACGPPQAVLASGTSERDDDESQRSIQETVVMKLIEARRGKHHEQHYQRERPHQALSAGQGKLRDALRAPLSK